MSAANLALADRVLGLGIDVRSAHGAAVATPAGPEDVCRLVREAGALAAPPRLVPIGGGTRILASRPDVASDVVREDCLFVDLSRLAGVVEYEPGDGTLTALAGTPFDELRAVVAEGGHDLTPDAPMPAPGDAAAFALGTGRPTLGGVLASGASGPDRLRRGPARHHVLGATIATASGTLARSGGRLVKNVTGFDVFRLHLGARGTLGVIVEASLRLMPRPEHEALLELEGIAARDAFALAEALRRGPVQPLATFARSDGGDAWRLAVHLAGRGRQVERDAERALAVLAGAAATLGAEARAAASRWRDALPGARPRELRLSIGARPSTLQSVALEVSRWSAARHGSPPAFQLAWPGVARLWVVVRGGAEASDGESGDSAAIGPSLDELGARLAPFGASLEWCGGSLAAAAALESMREAARAAAAPGRATDGAPWEAALRRGLDPRGLFAASPLAGTLRS